MSNTHFYTSCTNNYLPLARVLAKSLKKFHPTGYLHLVLCDSVLESFDLDKEDFDNVITVEDLAIPNLKPWLFKHSVIELCTAVKGTAAKHIMSSYDCDNLIYFDPDVAVFSPLEDLINNLENSDILITPHQLRPEKIFSAIAENEISFLRHGTYNLGFVGVKNTSNGREFVDWWADRCLNFCYTDTEYGLYTDQRWIDLVPAFFNGVNISKNPGYNVANWNLSNRDLQGNLEEQVTVNGEPLCFYHFSGSQKIMPEKYNLHNETTNALWAWYQAQLEAAGQAELSKLVCTYNFFENGELIPNQARELYRQVQEVEDKNPNPFSEEFYRWYLSHKQYLEQQSVDFIKKSLETNQEDLAKCQELVEAMESSKFWKLRQGWIKTKTKIRQTLKSRLGWVRRIPKNKTEVDVWIYNRLKLDIVPQYSPRKLEIPESYYQENQQSSSDLPKISLVTPSYNQAHFIEDTVKSVLEQNYPNLQYIIQDGKSKDNTAEVIHKYLEQYSDRLKFNCTQDSGQGNAINLGFADTDGEIMAWLNSDDVLLPGSLAYVADYFQNHPEVDLIYGHRIIIDEHNQETGRWILPSHEDRDNMLSWIDYVPQETMFWRRELWQKIGANIDESFRFALDWDLILRFRDAGAVIHRVPRFLGAFRVHQQQKTQAWNEIGMQEMDRLRLQQHNYVPTNLEIIKHINRYLIRSFIFSRLHILNKVTART